MSLLNWVLNDETSQVYGSDINYDLRDVSVGAAIQTQAASEFSPQAFTHNGIGFKAFIAGEQIEEDVTDQPCQKTVRQATLRVS